MAEHTCSSSNPIPIGHSERVCDTCGGPTMELKEVKQPKKDKKSQDTEEA